ncbi:pantoate--beta-alanine ligase [Candidatus Poribacteria bacterium]|nr:pantoate--beta-alanine ligase [Candidatus Poribacteria bacterium]
MDTLQNRGAMARWRDADVEASVGLVPTMGFLHEGHLSLVRRARAENDRVLVSIFVNPTQFGPNEDLEDYPRDIGRDCALLAREGVDAVFMPSVEDMYPDGFATEVAVSGPLTERLCGASRPTHFAGVTTVVARLFGLTRPDRAYFGRKDAQQLAVIRRMAADLALPVEVVGCPIVREPDGLAMSSRNVYLSDAERAQALTLRESLLLAERRVTEGVRDPSAIRDETVGLFARRPLLRLDYVELVHVETLEPAPTLAGPVLLALAAFVGRTRLIDNTTLQPDE